MRLSSKNPRLVTSTSSGKLTNMESFCGLKSCVTTEESGVVLDGIPVFVRDRKGKFEKNELVLDYGNQSISTSLI